MSEIKADGHCLYRAVAEQLALTGRRPGLTEESYPLMRQEAARYAPNFFFVATLGYRWSSVIRAVGSRGLIQVGVFGACGVCSRSNVCCPFCCCGLDDEWLWEVAKNINGR